MNSSQQRIEAAINSVDAFSADSLGLLRELLPHKQRFRPYSEVFRRGTVLWSVASAIDGLRELPEALDHFLPLKPGDNPLFAIVRDESIATASVVFKAWVSLAYMRFDDLLKEFEGIADRGEHLDSFVSLLRSDDVRHIRNAIAHGTFEAESGVFRWRDRKIEGSLPYDVLNRLNQSVFTLWLSVDAIAVAPDGATLE